MSIDIEVALKRLGSAAAALTDSSFMDRIQEIVADCDRKVERAGTAYHRDIAAIRMVCLQEIKSAVRDWRGAVPAEVRDELQQWAAEDEEDSAD